MLKLEFSFILKDDMEAKLYCFQGKMPAERHVSSLAANQVYSPCFIQERFLLWFLGSGCVDVCTPLSVESLRFNDCWCTPKIILSALDKGIQNGFQRIPFFFILLDFVCRPSSNSSWLQNDFGLGLLQINSTILLFIPPKKYYLVWRGLLAPVGLSIAQDKLKKWIKILHKNKVNGQSIQKILNNTHILVNYHC